MKRERCDAMQSRSERERKGLEILLYIHMFVTEV